MSIRTEAVHWLASNYGVRGRGICTSKFYRPEESWPKRRVWWFEIPLDYINASDSTQIHLVCQVAPNRNDFYYLNVPIVFFREHLRHLKIRKDNGRVSIYLSADPNHMFLEERGTGDINFSGFVVSKEKLKS